MSQYPKETGNKGELSAIKYLKDKGFSIIQKNYRTRLGEIDIVAFKDKILHFIEVKIYEAIDQRKLNHLKRALYMFLLQNNYKNYKLKVGLISILLDRGEIKFYDDLEV